MRPITVLNSEARLFWSVFGLKLTRFCVSNGYIDIKMQKAFLEGISGCVEHGTILGEILRDAREKQRSLCIVWLDLANAYGSIKHMLAQFAMWWYHVPQEMAELLFDYYQYLVFRVQTEDWTSDWFQLEIGVFQGCTAAPIVFNIAFQLLLDIHAHLTGKLAGYRLSGTTISIARSAYADDIQLIQPLARQTQLSTDAFHTACGWSRTLMLKIRKCRSLAYRKFVATQVDCPFTACQNRAYSCYNPLLTIGGTPVPFVHDDKVPIFKYLGRKVQFDFRVDVICSQIDVMLTKWLELVDRSVLTGPQKAWIANHLICDMLSWSLMIHDFSQSQVKKWTLTIQRLLRKWMGMARCANTSILYRSSEHFGLEFKHLPVMHAQQQVVKWHLMKHSQDPIARAVYQRRLVLDQKRHIGTGRKTAPSLEVERLESLAKFEKATSDGQHGRAGLGSVRRKVAETPKEIRQRMSALIKKEAEEKRIAICLEYEMQANWLSWDWLYEHVRKDLTWNKMLTEYSEALTKFTINALANTLPSGDNLRRWGVAANCSCGLCNQPNVTLNHTLAGCQWVRAVENRTESGDRFTWRHNCLLREIAKAVADFITHINALPEPVASKGKNVTFVKPGATTKSRRCKSRQRVGVLHCARDWIFDFDLPEWEKNGPYLFPHEVAVSSLRPDGVLVSRESKKCIILELTSPLEENIQAWHSKKTEKYMSEIAAQCNPGWTIDVLAVEVGAKGWIPPSFFRAFKKLGFPSARTTKLTDDCSILARKCSYLIWINRFNKQFEPWRICMSSSFDLSFWRNRGRESVRAEKQALERRISRNKATALAKLAEKKRRREEERRIKTTELN